MASPILLLALWQLGSAIGLIPQDVLPAPSLIGEAGVDLIRNGQLADALGVSGVRVIKGLVLGGAVGVVLGTAVGLSRWFEATVDPPMQMVQALVSGGDDVEQRRFGDWLGDDDRYARTGEFLHIVNSVWRQDHLDYEGTYYTVQDARVSVPPNPLPQIYFGGSSPTALPIAAEHVDVYLTWGEPPQAADRGRSVRFGIRLHTISRDSSAAAWAVADDLVNELTEEQIAEATALRARSESEGQRRTTEFHGGRTDKLEIYPNLWAGVGLVRGGAGTALVGSHDEVAGLIDEYHSLGFDEFILSGYPHLEEAYWFAEGVLPILRRKGIA